MKRIAYILSAVAIIVTIVIGLDTMSKPYTLSAFGFILWAVSPYGLLMILIKEAKSKAARIGILVLCAIVCLLGLILIIDAMYIHLDAQSGLVYIFAPLWQWVGLLIFAVPVLLLNKVKNA